MNDQQKKALMAVAAVGLGVLTLPVSVLAPFAGFAIGVAAILWLIGLWR